MSKSVDGRLTVGVIRRVAQGMMALWCVGCAATEPTPFESIAGDWVGSGGGLGIEVTFDPPQCDWGCVVDSGRGTWSLESAGEAGTITSVNFLLPLRSERRLVVGDEMSIALTDFPNGQCFRFQATLVDERTLAGQLWQHCGGGGWQVAEIDTEFTLVKQ